MSNKKPSGATHTILKDDDVWFLKWSFLLHGWLAWDEETKQWCDFYQPKKEDIEIIISN